MDNQKTEVRRQKSEVRSQDVYVTSFILPSVFCILCSIFCLLAAYSDEITGGFKFISPSLEDKDKWRVEGDKAQFISEDVVEISPVRAIIGPVKEPEYLIQAPWARLDRKTYNVWTDSTVEIIRGQSRLTGEGLDWDASQKKAVIKKNVRMTLDLDQARERDLI